MNIVNLLLVFPLFSLNTVLLRQHDLVGGDRGLRRGWR
jgi:hypothetical protein